MVQVNEEGMKLNDTLQLLAYADDVNLLTPNVNYSGRTAPLTSIKLHFIYLFNKYRY